MENAPTSGSPPASMQTAPPGMTSQQPVQMLGQNGPMTFIPPMGGYVPSGTMPVGWVMQGVQGGAVPMMYPQQGFMGGMVPVQGMPGSLPGQSGQGMMNAGGGVPWQAYQVPTGVHPGSFTPLPPPSTHLPTVPVSSEGVDSGASQEGAGNGAEVSGGGSCKKRPPPTKEGGGPTKAFPKHYFPLLAKHLVSTDVMAMDDIASAFIKDNPGPSQRLTTESIKRIAEKRKSGQSGKLAWCIRDEFQGLLRGESVDVDAIAPPVPKPPRKSTAHNLPSSATPSSTGLQHTGTGNDSVTSNPVKKPKVEHITPTPATTTPAPVYLEKYSTESALALCDVIVSVLNATLTGDDTAFMGKKPPSKIDWTAVCNAIKETTQLRTPLECQRLWKYIAYGIDVGELGVLAPDSDTEDVEKPNPTTTKPISDATK